MRRSIVLVGFMAAGKSEIGRLLAKRVNLPFVDTDELIEKSLGMAVAEIFRQRGEARFREVERELIARLVGEGAQLIALGGGAFVDEQNRELLNRSARTVWLDVPFELIMSRLRRSPNRPLAANRSEAELRALWIARRSHYALAQVHVPIGHAEPSQVVGRILEALNSLA